MGGLDLYIQAIVAVFVITDPISRGIYFRQLTASEPERRPEYIRKVTIAVAITLFGSALIGKQLLDLMGIDLGAFGVAGGLIVALMGFQMLFGGQTSGPQGGKEADQVPESFEGSVVVPYAIPFVAGPGAITTVITISSTTSDWTGTLAALVAVAVSVTLLPIGHLSVAQHLNPSPQTEQLLTRIGGLLVATIGIQLMLGGISRYFLGG